VIRFEALQPNERWQVDLTHWQLADGTGVEILNLLDDHSRLNVAADARVTTLAEDVVITFGKAVARHGIPASLLSDNGAIFTGASRGAGRVALEIELGLLQVRFDHSRPYHPQTCGKVERFHQTQKKWLTTTTTNLATNLATDLWRPPRRRPPTTAHRRTTQKPKIRPSPHQSIGWWIRDRASPAVATRAKAKLLAIGDKYLDGYAAARVLGVPMDDE
jgi:transposase InsO family protein